MLAVKVAISPWKFIWSCQLRSCPLCKYVYTSSNSKYAVQHYVCSANRCVVKLKIFLRKRKCESQKLELMHTSGTGRKRKERTHEEKKHDMAHESLPS